MKHISTGLQIRILVLAGLIVASATWKAGGGDEQATLITRAIVARRRRKGFPSSHDPTTDHRAAGHRAIHDPRQSANLLHSIISA